MKGKRTIQINAHVVEQFEQSDEMLLLVKGGEGPEASVERINIFNCSYQINKKKCVIKQPIDVEEQ